MKLSAPIYRLKRNARLLSRQKKIPLMQALDEIARQEGCQSWSLLAARLSAEAPAARLFGQLRQGDLLLVGARPGQGKTLLGLELALEAIKSGSRGAFFSLEYALQDVQDCLGAIGADRGLPQNRFAFDGSDAISADYLIASLAGAPRGTLAVIDYLQLLDQRRISRRDRQHPPASFPLRREAPGRGKVSQRSVGGADLSCDGWGSKIN